MPSKKDKRDTLLWNIDEPIKRRIEENLAVCFRGWVVSLTGEQVQIFVNINEGPRLEYSIDQNRPDVLKHLQGTVELQHEKVGFKIWIDLREFIGPKPVIISLEFSDGTCSVKTENYKVVQTNRIELSRAEYAEVWNNVAHTEAEAQIAVAGYTSGSKKWRETADYFVQNILEKTVGIKKTDTILEIGAGVGRVGEVLAPKCRQWIGADVSAKMLSYLDNRLSQLSNVKSIELNGYDLSPIASESLDVVYSHVVFMHIDEWERYSYIKEGLRVLKPGGRMYVDNYNLLSDDGWDFFLKNLNEYHPLRRPPNISKSSTPQELRAYFERAGFENINQGEFSFWTSIWGIKPSKTNQKLVD